MTYAFSGTDPSPGSGMGPCDTVTYTGPDTPAASVTGGCSDNAGNRTDASDVFHYDGTKPSVTGAAASRAPDHNGWYTHPVAFSFQGTDPTSGIASCSTHTYSGPDDGTAQLAGSCTDGAGNVGTKTISFKYDSSPPAKSKPFAVPGNRTIGVSWAPPSDAASFVLTRAPAGGPAVTIYRGSDHDYVDQGLRNGRKYTYAITSLDAAGNQSAPVAISAVPDGSTLRPFLDTEVSQPPTLTWAKARKAHYYNLQLYRGRTKVLSVWPTSSARAAQVKVALQPPQVLPQAGALPLVRLARHRQHGGPPLRHDGGLEHLPRRQVAEPKRDVAVLALRPLDALGLQRLERVDQARARLVRDQHVVDVAALGRRVGVREARLVVGDQLLAALVGRR